MNKVKRFSLEERYGYQNRKVIYDKNTDNDIELNNIYPIIDLFNQLDEQITDLQHEKEIIQKALDLACQTLYDINFQLYNTEMDFKEYFKQQAKEMLKSE